MVQLFSPDEKDKIKYSHVFSRAHFASYTLMTMKWEKNNRTIKHPCKKVQKVKKATVELIGLKDKKAIVRMAIKALHNVKAFRTQKTKKAKKAKKQRIGQKEKKAIVRMAVRALHNSKVFKIKETQEGKNQGVASRWKNSKKLDKRAALAKRFCNPKFGKLFSL